MCISQELKLNRIECYPCEQTGYMAIVQAELTTANGVISDFGTATNETVNTNDSKAIIESARQEALERINQKEQSSISAQAVTTNSRDTKNKKSYNHSGTSPASQKQYSLIHSLLDGRDINSFCREVVGKDAEFLSSKDANEIIQKLKQE